MDINITMDQHTAIVLTWIAVLAFGAFVIWRITR